MFDYTYFSLTERNMSIRASKQLAIVSWPSSSGQALSCGQCSLRDCGDCAEFAETPGTSLGASSGCTRISVPMMKVIPCLRCLDYLQHPTLWAGCLHCWCRKAGFYHGGNEFSASLQTLTTVGFRYIENGSLASPNHVGRLGMSPSPYRLHRIVAGRMRHAQLTTCEPAFRI